MQVPIFTTCTDKYRLVPNTVIVISPYLLVSGVTQYSLYRCAMAEGITIGTGTELTTSAPAYPAQLRAYRYKLHYYYQ